MNPCRTANRFLNNVPSRKKTTADARCSRGPLKCRCATELLQVLEFLRNGPFVSTAEFAGEVRYALAKALRKRGFEVLEARTGKEVHDEDIADADILVTDILMPEEDGIELLIKLSKLAPELPVIAISGGGKISSGNYLEMASSLGAIAVFKKPFDENDLIAAIQGAVNPVP